MKGSIAALAGTLSALPTNLRGTRAVLPATSLAYSAYMCREYAKAYPQLTHRLARRCSDRYSSSCVPSTRQFEQVSSASRSTFTLSPFVSNDCWCERAAYRATRPALYPIGPVYHPMIHGECTGYDHHEVATAGDVGMPPAGAELSLPLHYLQYLRPQYLGQLRAVRGRQGEHLR